MCYKTFIGLAVLMVGIVLTNGQKEPNDIGPVKNLDQNLEAALSTSDLAVLDQIVADNYVEINAQGDTSYKAQVLSDARARKSAQTGVTVGPERIVNEQTIRLHGNTAIVLCMISTKHLFMDYQTTGPTSSPPQVGDQERRTRVYSRGSAGWQLLAQQTTAIPKR